MGNKVGRCLGFAAWVAMGAGLPTAAHALTAAQGGPGTTRSHQQLGRIKALRGTQTSYKYVQVTADVAEAWTASAEGAFVEVDPPTQQTGTGTVRVVIHSEALAGDGPFDGAVVVTPAAGGAAVRIPVAVNLWPRDGDDLTPAQARDRSYWISDPDFAGDWDFWSFLPDDTTHPGENAGVNLRAEEKTACSGGTTANCTRPGQAGLASGQSIDRAWQLTVGDPRIRVAVLDSGIRWRQDSLVEKAYLNAAELAGCAPPGATPGNPATYDVNGDGLFNVRDYDLADPPYPDLNGTGRLDAQDLIHGTNPVTATPCSDGVDDDLNGYVDDISGWDFFWNDNDPSDDTDYGHGTGEARDSVAQGHDDTNDVGVCMACTLLPVRVGDSFIADVNQFAEGVSFAVDSGAMVVQEALGTLNNTPFMQQAIDYAWRNNVLVVASAADETSRHHNYPGNGEHVINVHAIVYDTDGAPGRWRSATTFLNFNNCTNYGAHLHLSTPGSSCSSEATGKTAGQAGLLYSYYRQLADGTDAYYQVPLSASEAFQVLIGSADDIDVTGAEADPAALAAKKYISNAGWDEAFGYGRNNARRALEMIRDQRIPPELYIDSPRWFESVDPTVSPALEVTGQVNVRRDATASWALQVAKGVAPSDDAFVQVAQGSVTQGQPLNGVLGSVDLSTLFEDTQTPDRNVDARTVTIRLVATVNRGATIISGEFRKAFSVLADPQRRRALALFLGTSVEGSLRMTDIDGDGVDELLMPLSDGTVHAVRGDGSALPGWPVTVATYGSFSDAMCATTDVALLRKCHRGAASYQAGNIDPTAIHSSIVSTPAVGDLDGDGSPERDVVVSDMDGAVTAFSHAGVVLPGWPRRVDPAHVEEFVWGKFQPTENRSAEVGFFAPPVLVDLDGDSDLEVVIGGMDQWLYAWHHDGTDVNGFPVHLADTLVAVGPNGRLEDRILAPVTVADLDGDGTPELVVGSEELINNTTAAYIYAVKAQGNAAVGGPFVPGWPVRIAGFVNDVLPYVGKGMPNAVAAADLDGNGTDEVVAAAMGGAVTKLDGLGHEFGAVAAMNQSQEYFGAGASTSELLVASLINYPALADLNGDGKLDVINGTAGLGLAGAAQSGGLRIPFEHSITAWDLDNGYMLDGFPQTVEDYQFFMNYSVGDIDGDGRPEALGGSGVYMVHAFNAQGVEPAGWPKNTHGWVATTPALGDLDGDNKMEVAVASREGWLFVWDMPGRVKKTSADEVGPIQWAGYHHDDHNTGNVRTPLRDYGVTPADDETPDDDQCRCARVPLHRRWAGLYLALGLLGARRARRRKA